MTRVELTLRNLSGRQLHPVIRWETYSARAYPAGKLTGVSNIMPRLTVYRGHSGFWYWRLRAGNGKVVADGSEGYMKKGNALRAARRVRAIFAGLPVF